MAGVALKRRGVGARVNWSHPLAQGLRCFYVFDGSTFVCLVTGNRMTRQTSLTRGGTVYGEAGKSTAVSSGAFVLLSDIEMTVPAYPISFTWAGVFRAGYTNGAGLWSITQGTPDDAASTTPFLMGIDRDTASSVRFYAPNGATFVTALIGTDISAGAPTVITGVATASGKILYQNGIRIANNGTALANPVLTTPHFAVQAFQTDRAPASECSAVMLHTRALAQTEVADLYEDPFAMLE